MVILHCTTLCWIQSNMPISNITQEIISFHFKIFQLCVWSILNCVMSTVVHLMFFASTPNMVLFVVDVHLSLFRSVSCLVVLNILKWICSLLLFLVRNSSTCWRILCKLSDPLRQYGQYSLSFANSKQQNVTFDNSTVPKIYDIG